MPSQYAEPLLKLIAEFSKMPGVGPKSAQRLVFYILQTPQSEVEKLIEALQEVKTKIKRCSVCYNFTVDDPCKICSDPQRNRSLLCVVSESKDLIAIEKTREYKGLYHILGGVISPLEGVGAENLRVKELLNRLSREEIKEIILATNPTAEGEATALYLSRLIKPLGIKLSRIAYGLPVGSDMDYADEVTISKAMEGRLEI